VPANDLSEDFPIMTSASFQTVSKSADILPCSFCSIPRRKSSRVTDFSGDDPLSRMGIIPLFVRKIGACPGTTRSLPARSQIGKS
jgi:hypothetical protein